MGIRIVIIIAAVAAAAVSTSGCAGEAAGGRQGTTAGDKTWIGEGTVFDEQARPTGDYDVRLEQHPTGEGRIEQTVRITLPDGSTKEFTQQLAQRGRHLEIRSQQARGGGLDLGDGMLHTYVETGEGCAQAQTIAMDGDERMRIVRTELEDGEAVRFFRESYRLRSAGGTAD